MIRLASRLLLTLLVLAVLAVGADRAAAFLAARGVARTLQQAQRIPTPPSVTFRGVPFLTQAVTGRYEAVDVAMRDVPSENGLVVERLDTALDGVHAPLQQVIGGSLAALPVDHADAVAHVTFAALEASADKRLAAQGVRITLRRAAADRIGVTATVNTRLGAFTVSGQARLSASRGRVRVTLLPETLSGVPPVLRAAAARQIDVSVLAPALPFRLTIRSVTVDASGLQLDATGSNLTLK
jgi:hypothetical protein